MLPKPDAPTLLSARVRVSCEVAVIALSFGFLNHAPAVNAEPRATGVLQLDACTLLEPAEISEVVGLPVHPGIRQDVGYESDGSYSSACLWAIKARKETSQPGTSTSLDRSFAILHVMNWPSGSGQSAKYLQAFRDAALQGEIPSDPVPRDVGDEALWWGDGLAVRQGDTGFGISVLLAGSETGEPGAFEEILAPFVLRRLAEKEKDPGG